MFPVHICIHDFPSQNILLPCILIYLYIYYFYYEGDIGILQKIEKFMIPLPNAKYY